jgi:hypothetical protein
MELTLIVEEGEERFDEGTLDEMLSVLGRAVESCAVRRK